MNALDVGFVIAGFVLLFLGGESLVRGASTIAIRVGISPLVIGLVVVSGATSAPELAVPREQSSAGNLTWHSETLWAQILRTFS